MYCRKTILFLSASMETSLYQPVKAFLEKAEYLVKGEIGGCDLMGIRDDDPSVIVVCELKLAFNLELILQAVDRASISDEVWIAAKCLPAAKGVKQTSVIAICVDDWG